jgi:hypothetical protein
MILKKVELYFMCAMNIKMENIEVVIKGEPFLANLK